MINAISLGNVIEYSNQTGSKITSSSVVVIGKLVGVAVADIENGAVGAVAIKGNFSLPKKTKSEVLAAGDVLIYDSGITKADGTSGALLGKDIIVGVASKASAATDDNVDVLLGL